MNNVSTPQQTVTFNSFLPVVVLSVAFFVILVWTLVMSVYDYSAANRQRDQLIAAQIQAAGVEQKMKSLMEGLLNLAEIDPDAKAIAEKYQISFNQPVAAAQPLTPAKTGTPAPVPPSVLPSRPTPTPPPAPSAPPTRSTAPARSTASAGKRTPPPPPAVTSIVTEIKAPANAAEQN